MSNYAREKMIKKLIDAALYCLNLENSDDLENIEKFLTHFFAIKGPDFFKTFDTDEKIKEYSATLCDLWHHFNEIAPAETPRIYLFENSFNKHQTYVSIINKDMPFLVATVQIILKDLGLKPALFMHPVLTTLRKTSGHLEKVLKTKNRSKDDDCVIHEESVIHFMLPLSESALKKTTFIDRIKESFSDIAFVAKDRKKILDHMHALAGTFEKNMLVTYKKNHNEEQFHSISSFLKWMDHEYFAPCGYRYFEYVKNGTLSKNTTDCLGLFTKNHINGDAAYEPYLQDKDTHDDYLTFDKLNVRSTFNRGSRFDGINVLALNDQGHVVGVHQYIGLFTTKIFECSPENIPILKNRIQSLFDRFGFKRDWYNGKLLSLIIESIPLDLLLVQSQDEIYHLCEIVLRLQNNISVFYRAEETSENIIFLIYVPTDKYSFELKESFKNHIACQFNSVVRSEHVFLREADFARIVFSVDIKDGDATYPSEKQLSNELTLLSETWIERLMKISDAPIAENINDLFPKKYKQNFTPDDALTIYDGYLHMQKHGDTINFSVAKIDDKIRLNIIKSGDPILLAQILSIIEKFGLEIISETTFKLNANETISLHVFTLQFDHDEHNFEKIAHNLVDGLYHVWHANAESDYLNTLIQLKALNIREVILLRAYIRALLQMGIRYSFDYMAQCLRHHPKVVGYFVELFHARFHPENVDLEKSELLVHKINKYIKTLEKLDDDRIIRRLMNAMTSTLRTNYYQIDKTTKKQKTYLSLKFDSQLLDGLPNPRPLYEIFVYSHLMEGCHLRGGKVARGGIRWSDRLEDYRSEVLALMKAQMVKNSVIVPLGSKGGFVARRYEYLRQQGATPAELKEYVIKCYQTLMRGLLDLTDNRVGDKIVTPDHCVCYDAPDPYLVVAADKGTATFSDIANAISEGYDFWLGDAFASGGSKGYDHKKMAITARGAWISIAQHFNEMGIDIYKNPFTVIGVGDMAGDVFGNGMLQTPHAKLIAAFNHEHIFVDPNPDMAAAFKERKRLFNLPGSKWSDYDPAILSEGGHVFNRSDKSIKLNPAIHATLGIDSKQSELTPDELIAHLLRTQVDLLWFAGIGTFVKSKTESNDAVKDHINDGVRANGCDIRARVIGEGANLGMTQLGRIEYAANGGRLNTDAIDNSAGVDCSDHEVNIKILFTQLEQSGVVNRNERDTLLKSMTDEVAELVLNDNREQNHIITVMQSRAEQDLFSYAGLMRHLANEKALPLSRAIEFLPDDEEIQKRHLQHQGLTRPELSVILAYVKINLYTQILPVIDTINVNTDPFLINYFPQALRNKYERAILNHGLKNEIKATVLANYLVNRLGALFFYEMGLSSNHSISHLVATCLKIIEIFDLDEIWTVIAKHKTHSDHHYVLISLMRQMMRIALRSRAISVDAKDSVLQLMEAYANALKIKYTTTPTPHHLEDTLRVARYFPIILESICDDSDTAHKPQDFVRVHQHLTSMLHLDLFEGMRKAIMPQADWERMVKNTLSDDFSAAQWHLLKACLSHGNESSIEIDQETYTQKLVPIQMAVASGQNMTLGHLTYCVKLLQQLVPGL